MKKILFIIIGLLILTSVVSAEYDYGFLWSNQSSPTNITNPPRDAAVSTFSVTGKVYFTGGYYDNAGTITHYDDVYESTDCVNWSKVATNPFNGGGRRGAKMIEYDSKLWLMGGYLVNGTLMGDVYSSADGATWSLVKANAFPPRAYFEASTALAENITIMGGAGMNDYRPSKVTSFSGDFSGWFRQGRNWTAAACDGTYLYFISAYYKYIYNAADFTLVNSWVTINNCNNGAFTDATGMIVNGSYLYVCDNGCDRIQRVYKNNYTYAGKSSYAFTSPVDVQEDGTYLYVSDEGAGEIVKLSKTTLAYSSKYSSTFNGRTFKPTRMAICGDYLYVVDSQYDRIIKCNKNTFAFVAEVMGQSPYSMFGGEFYALNMSGMASHLMSIAANETYVWAECEGDVVKKFWAENLTFVCDSSVYEGDPAGDGSQMFFINTTHMGIVGDSYYDIWRLDDSSLINHGYYNDMWKSSDGINWLIGTGRRYAVNDKANIGTNGDSGYFIDDNGVLQWQSIPQVDNSDDGHTSVSGRPDWTASGWMGAGWGQPSGLPPDLTNATIYSADDALYLFGGQSLYTPLSGVYASKCNGTVGWYDQCKPFEIITTSPGWANRSGHATVMYDNALWVFFGGRPASTHYSDVWNTSTCSGSIIPKFTAWSDGWGVFPLTVNFVDLSYSNIGADPLTWQWDYGDGTSNGTTQNPSHTYSSLDNYNVTLTVCNACECEVCQENQTTNDVGIFGRVDVFDTLGHTYANNTWDGAVVKVYNNNTDRWFNTTVISDGPWGIDDVFVIPAIFNEGDLGYIYSEFHGYNSTPRNFTAPYEHVGGTTEHNGTYRFDTFIFPSNITHDVGTVFGQVFDQYTGQGFENRVYRNNSTEDGSGYGYEDSAGWTGWFLFGENQNYDDWNYSTDYLLYLCNGTSDYLHCLDFNVTPLESELVWADLPSEPKYYVECEFRDAGAGSAFLSSQVDLVVRYSVNNTEYVVTSTTNGTIAMYDVPTWSLDYTASCSGFSDVTMQKVMPYDAIPATGYAYPEATFVFYFNYTAPTPTPTPTSPTPTPTPTNPASSDGGMGLKYPPHQVRFICHDYFGNPCVNVQVSAVAVETTMGSWDWLSNLFGINQSTTNLTAPMTGRTGSDGSIDFIMSESIRYEMGFVDATQGINYNMSIYPHEAEILVHLPSQNSIMDVPMYEAGVSYNLTTQYYNSSFTRLACNYVDTGGSTAAVTFWVRDVNGTDVYTLNAVDPNNVNESYIVQSEGGQTFYWGFNASHDTYGNFTQGKTISFAGTVDVGLNPQYYQWIAIGFIILIGALFSAASIKFAGVVVPMIGIMMWYMGWLPMDGIKGPVILGSLLTIGVLSYIRKSEVKASV